MIIVRREAVQNRELLVLDLHCVYSLKPFPCYASK